MDGLARLLRSHPSQDLRAGSRRYEWSEGKAELALDEVTFRGSRGAVMWYANPPVHQIGNPGLAAMRAALDEVRDDTFLLFTWPCDGVHAGGDLKESLLRLEETIEGEARLEEKGGTPADRDQLYEWADRRLDQGQALYRRVRELSRQVRTVAVCGGGARFGGSAEVNLMADFLVGDSRSSMCFSEAMIGLIPGWAGVGRVVTKAGPASSRAMALTARPVSAIDLIRIGVYDRVVDIATPFPRKARSGDSGKDSQAFRMALQAHDEDVWPVLVDAALDLAVSGEARGPAPWDRQPLATASEVAEEVSVRGNPQTYEGLWAQGLGEAREPLAVLGRPLAPQSVEAVEKLFSTVTGATPDDFDEDGFVEAEKNADSKLYRDPRLLEGIRATLAQKVPDFRRAPTTKLFLGGP